MVINTNVQALQTANNLNTSSANLAKSLGRLSSGSKIIAPSDDAAGLAVSSRLESQLKRLDAAINNVTNAVSFTQTQDGFLKTIDKAFRRMSELAMFAQDATKSASDKELYSLEFSQLQDYVAQSVKQTFNSVNLFSTNPLSVTIDSGGTTFDMPPIDLEKSDYLTSLSKAATVSSTTTRLTRDLTAKTITLEVSEEEYNKVAVGGSFSLTNLTTGRSDTDLKAAKATQAQKAAAKTAADAGVAGNALATLYVDTKADETAKAALSVAAATAKTVAATAKIAADAAKVVAASAKTAAAAALTAATTAASAAAAGTDAALTASTAAALTAATTASTAADTAFTTADTAAANALIKVNTTTSAAADAVSAAAAAVTATGTVSTLLAADTTAKGLVDAKTAADSAKAAADTVVATKQAAYNSASKKDISGLNGSYDISALSNTGGTYKITLDASNSSTAMTGSDVISGFDIDANPDSSTGVSLKSGLDITSAPRAQAALSRIKSSIDMLAQDRASLGAVQSRLNFTNEQLTVTKENLSAAISRIADVDVAEEATSYARYQILVQSGTSMLAAANKMPQSALQLLQG